MTNKPEEGPHVPDTVALLEAQARDIAAKDARIAELEDALKMAADDLDAAAKFTNFNIYHIAANQARAALNGEKL